MQTESMDALEAEGRALMERLKRQQLYNRILGIMLTLGLGLSSVVSFQNGLNVGRVQRWNDELHAYAAELTDRQERLTADRIEFNARMVRLINEWRGNPPLPAELAQPVDQKQEDCLEN